MKSYPWVILGDDLQVELEERYCEHLRADLLGLELVLSEDGYPVCPHLGEVSHWWKVVFHAGVVGNFGPLTIIDPIGDDLSQHSDLSACMVFRHGLTVGQILAMHDDYEAGLDD